MTMARADRRQAGITLIEVVIAVFIFTILGTMCWQTLDQTLRVSKRNEQELEALLGLQRAMQTLANDFSQYHPRPIREPVGNDWRPPLLADSRSNYLVEVTRSGYGNPLNAPRSTSQRISYRFDQGELIRAQWPVLDPVVATEPQETVILDGLEQIRFLYLGDGGDNWSEQWPPLGSSQAVPPRAVEIRLVHEYWGEIRRVIEIRT